MAELTHLSNAAFCRYFKKMTLMTFTEFLNQYRIDQAKKLLILDNKLFMIARLLYNKIIIVSSLFFDIKQLVSFFC